MSKKYIDLNTPNCDLKNEVIVFDVDKQKNTFKRRPSRFSNGFYYMLGFVFSLFFALVMGYNLFCYIETDIKELLLERNNYIEKLIKCIDNTR